MVTWTASDLARRRKEIIAAARQGVAQVRDTDGTMLVMLTADRLDAVGEMLRWAVARVRLGAALARPRDERQRADFGPDWGWAARLDEDDLASLLAEVDDALLDAVALDDLAPLTRTLTDWRLTAEVLRDDATRDALLSTAEITLSDFVEVRRPR